MKIEGFTPFAQFVDAGLLNGFALVQETAAVNRHRRLESIVERRHQTRCITAPTDTRHGGVFRVHLSEAPQQRMRTHDRGHRVKGPVITDITSNRIKLLHMPMVRTAIRKARTRVRLLRISSNNAIHIHRWI
jgi:hypothetical protein